MTLPASSGATVADAPPAPTPHLRPAWHFTTADRWLNDPNGLVHADGVYHLFFQTNPHGTTWGDISWGHATSTDLVHWTEHPTAIPARDGELVFSGSAVVDHDGTAGFGPGALVAVWTAARPGNQSQALAWSADGGRTFTRFDGNPVLDIGSAEFRDPYVLRYGAHWVMAVVEADRQRVALYTSPDLRGWTFASHVGPVGAVGGVWECPALLEVPVADGAPGERAWVLLLSLNPGGPTGGSGMQYLVGDFDGTTFTPAPLRDGEPRWLDHGHDYYAAVAWSDAPDRRALTIGWASSWQYAAQVPTAPWRSAMSLARELRLVRGADGALVLAQRPVLPAGAPVHAVGPGPGAVALDGPAVVDVVLPRGARLAVRDETGAAVLTVASDAEGLVVTRPAPAAGLDPHFTVPAVAPLPGDDPVALRAVVDGGVVEVFTTDGLVTFCELVLPGAPLAEVVVEH
ncbi:glycoside hydrolase family 32 protein [Cellulomonas sp. C5510]|uniref:glycoside hydrolase family 32 protein n=1 Tax=Cellulomonas sp. C5510 TaxID=2871170 RepID=UPI001C966810|nr:glycoside hydrolase family 32 protein [Cellulomonas sp. C5510]QZN85795.1 glycoside hydrolase family 32 protein [Cellulomonas sp. C5510]